ncbi:hypothetical protein [Acetobacter orientalis]|uniref:Uncharacterized protein n=1 Tax=Acetobacter orientalis TaxID=146474 RepID=A0A252A2Q8_9PROT|nr:hypothetical protein [Acetobacter orientalis]OUI82515.1 hypothetical protein HK12_03965 [Acetobacter orientalis]
MSKSELEKNWERQITDMLKQDLKSGTNAVWHAIYLVSPKNGRPGETIFEVSLLNEGGIFTGPLSFAPIANISERNIDLARNNRIYDTTLLRIKDPEKGIKDFRCREVETISSVVK